MSSQLIEARWIEAISQQVLVVGMVIREDLPIRIRSFTFVVNRILIFHVIATNESPSTWKKGDQSEQYIPASIKQKVQQMM